MLKMSLFSSERAQPKTNMAELNQNNASASDVCKFYDLLEDDFNNILESLTEKDLKSVS